MGYMLGDVEAAGRRILRACPGVRLERSDYGFGLKVIVVYRPARPDGQTELVSDIPTVIEELKRG